MKRHHNVYVLLTCGAEQFGLCNTFNIDVNVDVEVHVSDDNIEIQSLVVDYAVLKPKVSNGLETFVNHDYRCVWDDLSEDKQSEVISWVTEKLREKETIDIIEEKVIDQYVSEAERNQERFQER